MTDDKPDSFKNFQETFEIFANKQAAEIEAVRAVLQGFLVSILSTHAEGPALFQSLRDNVLESLDTETKNPDNDQDATRKAAFVHFEATLIFDEMNPVFGLPPTGSPQSKN